MSKKELKEAVDFALDEMPEDSMTKKEIKRYKKFFYSKIDNGEIKTMNDIEVVFDVLNN